MVFRRIVAATLLMLASSMAVALKPGQPVRNQAAAIALAEKTLITIYGKKQIDSERPFTAKLEGEVWHVWGYLPPTVEFGGVAEIWINQRTGKVLKVIHGK